MTGRIALKGLFVGSFRRPGDVNVSHPPGQVNLPGKSIKQDTLGLVTKQSGLHCRRQHCLVIRRWSLGGLRESPLSSHCRLINKIALKNTTMFSFLYFLPGPDISPLLLLFPLGPLQLSGYPLDFASVSLLKVNTVFLHKNMINFFMQCTKYCPYSPCLLLLITGVFF